MRRYLTGFVVAAVTAVVPALALAGNQEVAEQIASRLRNSGQLSDYKIGVKYQDGTAWLRGRVASQEQMETALRLTFQTPSVGRVVNELTIGSEAEQVRRRTAPPTPNATPAGYNPLRDRDAAPVAAKAAQRPQQLGLVKRLEAALTGGSEQPQPLPAREAAPARADRVPSSYAPANVERTAAEEPQELPRQMAAPRVPMTAMQPMQPMVRGPVAPNGWPDADVHGGQQPSGRGAGTIRPAVSAQLRLAKLRGLPELRLRDLSEAVFADGLAVHRPVLPISPGSARMAESDLGMG